MRLLRNFTVKLVLAISIALFYNCSVFVSGFPFPQWVWNPEANSAPVQQSSGSSSGDKLVFAETSTKDIKEQPLEIATQPRLFPSIINAVSNAIGNRPGNGGSGGSSSSSSACSSGTCVGGTVSQQAIENGINAGSQVVLDPGVQGILGTIVQGIFGGGASTLPGSIGGSKEPGGGGGTGSCSCVPAISCHLPNTASGNCDGDNQRVNCCSTRSGNGQTIFPGENDKPTRNTKTVTRSEIRRALLKNIVRGSGSVIDDTLDLILHPFLTEKDQVKVATRVLYDDQ